MYRQLLLWLVLVTLVLVIGTSCQLVLPGSGAPQSRPSTASNDNTADPPSGDRTMGGTEPYTSNEQELLPTVVVPSDVNMQISYTPGRSGGGDISGCQIAADKMEINSPTLFPAKDFIDIGSIVSICYVGFSVGEVVERIIAPDGAIVRESPFTVENNGNWATIEANDFAGLPTFTPGIYQVVAATPDGTFATQFKVTGQLAPPKNHTDIQILGPGITANASGTTTHLFLTNFGPNDTVDILFYTWCEPDDRVKNLKASGNWREKDMKGVGTYRTRARVQVDAQGQAVADVHQIIQQLDPNHSYDVIARGTLPPQQGGTDALPANSQTSLRGTPDWPLPICPIPPDQQPLPLAAPREQRDVQWTYKPDVYVHDFHIIDNYVLIEDLRTVVSIDRTTGEERWRSGPEENSGAILLDDTGAYVASRDLVVKRLDGATGKTEWSIILPMLVGAADSWPSFVDVANGMVYLLVGDVENTQSILYAIDHTTGQINWSTDELAPMLQNPVVAPERVYASLNNAQFAALDSRSGALQWFSNMGEVSSVQVAAELIYISTTTRSDTFVVRALRREDGQEQWQYEHSGTKPRFTLTPSYVIVHDQDGRFIMLNPQRGTEQWRTQTQESRFTPVEIDDVIFVGDDEGTLRALDRASGTERWSLQTQSYLEVGPVAAGDLLYLGGGDGYLYGIERTSGQGVWAFATERLNDINQPFVVKDGVVYFQTNALELPDHDLLYAIR